MSAIKLRRASPDDAAAFAEFFTDESVFGHTLQLPYPDAGRWRKRLEAVVDPGRPDIQLVAEIDGQVVGSGGLHTESKAVRRSHAVTLGLGVARAHQGQGVGDALMKALLDYADRWTGILRIELVAWSDNARAIRLYERHGFEHEGRMRAHGIKDGRFADAVAMARLHPRHPVLMDA